MPRVNEEITTVQVGGSVVASALVSGDATASIRGIATAAQITKLDGIAAGAQVNLAVGTTTGTVCAGDDGRLSIADATASNKGLATAAQITKLDGIAAGAQVNLAVGTTTGTVAAGDDSRFSIADATASNKGLATAAQITKLDGIAAGAQVNLAFGTTSGTVAEGNDARLGTITAHLLDGTPATVSGVAYTPGIVPANGTLQIWQGGKTAADVTLSTDASAAVLTEATIGTRLAVSSKYACTIGIRVLIYASADHSHVGSVDVVVDMYVTTSAGGVATVVVQTTPVPDTSRLHSTLAGATATVAAATGGFAISATRPVGVECKARASWWVTAFEGITS